MVATLTTHHSTFQNRSEQNSDPQRKPRRLHWKHSLWPIEKLVEANEHVLLQRVRPNEKRKQNVWIHHIPTLKR